MTDTRFGPSLAHDDLSRALLARQHLAPRAGPSVTTGERVVAEVRHLVGLQSQVPASPYAGLWSRLPGFGTDDLGSLLLDRSVVRVATLRGTVHLVTADDAFELTAHVRPAEVAHLRGRNEHGTALRDVDLADLARAATDLLAQPLTTVELGRRLAERWPAVAPKHLAFGARCLLPLVQVPPRGLWGASGPGTTTTWTTARAWLGDPTHRDAAELDAVATASDPDAVLAARVRLVRRYLAAFGPASVADVQKWSGLTGLRPAVEALRPELVTFTGPGRRRPAAGARDGRPAAAGRTVELFDLPDAPRPDGDAPVPVVLTADFDNVVLAHDDRTRVLGDVAVKQVVSVNGQVAATVLVDGRVAGTWTWQTGRDGAPQVDVRPLHPAAAPEPGTTPAPAVRLADAAVRDEVVARAEDWLAVAAPGAVPRVVVHDGA
ncbi:winged helix DNA-binding domain-containing protein [Cellulosimicrobium marinum]|uniref:winged helix DNA-binding domain-containing protein n=1 Tax=Cellulosimicrobium marinum TaxID=1638992 RepID=UPI001E48031D|nr:winged helix DNA-binding domain-containing protein [Cellulosimicrobium marinum]MCB7137220.1 winged helix DNA-binding domain-containing protein [Cellulosimicrobium marinum]